MIISIIAIDISVVDMPVISVLAAKNKFFYFIFRRVFAILFIKIVIL